VTAFEPLALFHSWPLAEQGQHFDLGLVMNSAITDAIAPADMDRLGVHHVGCWECNLEDNSLIWSGGVFDIFGLPRGSLITREDAAALYSEDSRAKMEALRAHAIRHRRGFTLDAEIRPVIGAARCMRLICAPVCEGDRAVRLHGLKFIV